VKNPRLLFLMLTLAVSARLPAAEKPEKQANSKLIIRHILPSKTHPEMKKFNGGDYQHLVCFNPSVPDKGLLLVWIPGAGSKPGDQTNFFSLAANEGLHVVSLAYADNINLTRFRDSADKYVIQSARENIMNGSNRDTWRVAGLFVDFHESIRGRLQYLLVYLDKHYPKENWHQFLKADGAHFAYANLVLAGNSEGGDYVALMAYEHNVARALMFGAPKDFNTLSNQPAYWMSDPSHTPMDRFFSFVHAKDESHGCAYPQQLEIYRAMELIPAYPVINVDKAKPPYQHTRLLTSERPSDFPHGALCTDTAYEGVWKYMLEEPVAPDEIKKQDKTKNPDRFYMKPTTNMIIIPTQR
jgi:hypothetical protein